MYRFADIIGLCMDIYHELLVEHYRSSPYRGTVNQASFTVNTLNPSCGDSITMTGMVTAGKIDQVLFDGAGCVISQATASLLCQATIGKSLAEVERYATTDIMALIGISLGPTRLKCALLALEALHVGLIEYRAHETKESHARSCQSSSSTTTGSP